MGCIQSVEGLKRKNLSPSKRKEFSLQTPFRLESLHQTLGISRLPACSAKFGLASPNNHVSSLLKIKLSASLCLHFPLCVCLYLSLCFSCSLSLYLSSCLLSVSLFFYTHTHIHIHTYKILVLFLWVTLITQSLFRPQT